MYIAIVLGDGVGDLLQAGAAALTAVVAAVALWLQHRQARQLRSLEAQLNRAGYEHQTQFAKLHDKRAEVIADLYKRVVILEIWLDHVVSETELPDEVFASREAVADSMDLVFAQVSLNLQDLAAYFNLNRLYLDEQVCETILRFHDTVLEKTAPISGYFYERFEQMSDTDLSELYGKDLRKRAHRALGEVTRSRRAIEAVFRNLIGIHVESKTSPQTAHGLMWIPQPESIDPIKRRRTQREEEV